MRREARCLDAEAGLAPVSTLGVVTVINVLAWGGPDRMAVVLLVAGRGLGRRREERAMSRGSRGLWALFVRGARTEWCYRFGDESTGG